jgi:superfamily I DNA/RNA helicase
LKAFEAGWARSTQDHPGLATVPEDRQFEAAVLRWLKDHRAILIGEVVPLAYDFLRHNPASSELSAFDHVIVDEYQDLNTCEQKLLDVLAENGSLCVAGDDDQSIYGMRYANPTGILEFIDRSEVTSFEILSCGRCPQLVIALANSLVRCSVAARSREDLVSSRPEIGEVDIVQWDTLDDEINGTIAAIASELQHEKFQPGEVLVLAHRRLIGERIRDGLRALSIPVESFFTEEELKAEPAQEALALFRLALNPEDLPALRVILGIGDDTGRSAAYQKVWAQSRTDGTTPRAILERLDAGDDFGFRASALVDRFRAARRKVSELDLENLRDLVDRLFPDGVVETAELREVALAELEGVITAQQLLDRLVVVITQDEVPQHPAFVRIMSLHKSKGLTSPRVYVAGLVEGVVPTVANRQGADLETAIEEQRRLLYVALTRTAVRLTLSCCLRMDFSVASSFGARVASGTTRGRRGALTCGVIASRYLRELGPRAPRPVRGAPWLEGLTGG